MRWLGKERIRFFQGQKGIGLLETLIAVGILAVIGIAFLTALSNTSRSVGTYEQRVMAQSLAQSQLEIVKAAAYDNTSPYYDNVSAPASVPPGYEITISATGNVTDKQNVTIVVSRDGHHLFQLTTIKVNR